MTIINTTSRRLAEANIRHTPAEATHLRRLAKKRTSKDDGGADDAEGEFVEHTDCLGGLPSSPCSNVTRDVLCHRCIEGYRRQKSDRGPCVPCGQSNLSGDVVWACITVPLSLLFVLVASKYLTTNDAVQMKCDHRMS